MKQIMKNMRKTTYKYLKVQTTYKHLKVTTLNKKYCIKLLKLLNQSKSKKITSQLYASSDHITEGGGCPCYN